METYPTLMAFPSIVMPDMPSRDRPFYASIVAEYADQKLGSDVECVTRRLCDTFQRCFEHGGVSGMECNIVEIDPLVSKNVYNGTGIVWSHRRDWVVHPKVWLTIGKNAPSALLGPSSTLGGRTRTWPLVAGNC